MRPTATIRDLRTRFPKIREMVDREGEVVVTHRGEPSFVLRRYQPEPSKRPAAIDYFARLSKRMPKPMSLKKTRALDDANREDR
jgi:antitoxin (DNA-binding transcriptional repressor) of toxin-antitoxin stability system